MPFGALVGIGPFGALFPSALVGGGRVNSVTCPDGVMRPIRLTANSVNQRLPSGPTVILDGSLWAVGIGNSVTCPGGATELPPHPVSTRRSRQKAMEFLT